MKKQLIVIAGLIIVLSTYTAALDLQAVSTHTESLEDGDIEKQLINVKIRGLSADGATDTVYFTFPENIDLRQNSLESNVSINSEASLADINSNGNPETITVGLNEEGSSNVTADLALDIGIKGINSSRNVDIMVEDSSNGVSTGTATIEMSDEKESDPETGPVNALLEFFSGLF